MKPQIRRLFPRGGVFHDKRRGKNRPNALLKEFFESAKQAGECRGIYEVRFQISRSDHPVKSFDFEITNTGTKISKARNNQSVTILHPKDLKLRMPKDDKSASEAISFDEKTRILSVR